MNILQTNNIINKVVIISLAGIKLSNEAKVLLRKESTIDNISSVIDFYNRTLKSDSNLFGTSYEAKSTI